MPDRRPAEVHCPPATPTLGRIVELLETLLPPELSARLAIEGLRRNTLYLRVDSASHRYELELAKEAQEPPDVSKLEAKLAKKRKQKANNPNIIVSQAELLPV